ncbi:MAG TPA: hypothetical protein VND96_09420 [Candidatus Micrarchaeaceae archaeon]|nr:hypothetical protein [Candidatus Micrarchaeaceae archaeon]
MAFGALLAFIFALGLSGRKATRGTFVAIGVAAVVASVWVYLS